MLRMLRRVLVAVIGLCSTLPWVPPAVAAPVTVVATIFPLADMVAQIGAEHVAVTTLLPPGASPHTFEPTPAQIREVAGAQVFVRIGAGLDAWAAKILAAHTGNIVVATVTDGLQLLGSGDDAGGDPHVWLDPVLVRDHVVGSIVNALRQADPADAAAFDRGAAAFRTALSDLDAEIVHTLAPVTDREYVAFHSAWRYFGGRYGLHEVAAIEPFPGKEPSAREIAAVIEKARAAHARVILIEPQFDPRLAQQIAHEFGGRVLSVDPLGGPAVAGRNTYIDLMRYDARAFAEAAR